MKLNRNNNEIKMERVFTDREEPRKAFWIKYNGMKQNLKQLEDVYILNYYGVGGIGKSSLLRELQKELVEKEEKPYFLLYDFQNNQDIYATLKIMRTTLIEKYKFEFPKFDIALICYAKKLGDKASKKEIQSMVEQSKTLSLILDAVEIIPQLSIATSLIKLADSGIAWIRNLNNQDFKTQIAKLENETSEDILKKLPKYFAEDMAKNIEHLDKPFVIFLDTYEKLIDTIGGEGREIGKDLWLRGDNGIVLNIPNVLWVIVGRERLRWEKYNQEWANSIEEYLLGDFGYLDADSYLEKAGFKDATLRKKLYELTNGTPVYLDICVNTLERLLQNGEEIAIDKFGGNTDELLARFIKYMDAQTREMTHLLCLLGTWEEKLLLEVGNKIISTFSPIIYDTLKESSFIIKEDDYYYVHQTVKQIINKECPALIKEKYNSIMYGFLYNYLANHYDVMDIKTSTYLNSYLEIIKETVNEENVNQYICEFAKIYNIVRSNGQIQLAHVILVNQYNLLKEKYDKSDNFYLLTYEYAKICELKRRYKTSNYFM